MTRTQNAAKNVFFGVLSNIRGLVLSFVSRTVFIYALGSTYLGISGLYSSVLSVLSLAELGFGTALTFAMYKPVADNDEDRIIKLLYFYRTVHRIVATIVASLGLALLPFLQYIVKGSDALSLFDLRLYFLIYLTNSVVSYFVSYKYCYVNALQKNYITTNIDTVIAIGVTVVQILVLVLTKSFLIYLLTQTVFSIISKFGIASYLNHIFPILRKKSSLRLSKEEKKPIYTEVKNLLVHNFARVAVHSTDNIIISSLSGLGVAAVGLVSNYNLIMTSVLGFVTLIFGSMTSGFGNIVASGDVDNYRKVFKEANFLNFWIYGFCSIAFFVLIPPFITLWIGDEYLIDQLSFLLIVLNCYFQGQCTVYNNARIAKGNFGKDKWNALCQAFVNLIISVIAAHYLGLLGVYIGTVCSRIIILIRPIKTYPFLFEQSSKEYYKSFFLYFALVLVAGGITYYISDLILSSVTVLRFIGAMAVVTIIPNAIFFLCFFRTDQFKKVLLRAKTLLKRG